MLTLSDHTFPIASPLQITVYGGELKSEERAFILDQVRVGILKIGSTTDRYGEIAGWLKDVLDRRFGPEWQAVVGKKDAFGSCLSPVAGHYLNFSIGEVSLLLFKS